jgi:hypothetical protein
MLLNFQFKEMKSFAKLLYRTYATYLPTAFPAHYYGMPNGKIYLVFSRFYRIAFDESGLEFVFAEHKDYSFDYNSETIVPLRKEQKPSPIFAEQVDAPKSKFKIFSVERKLRSYGEAQLFLNQIADRMKIQA